MQFEKNNFPRSRRGSQTTIAACARPRSYAAAAAPARQVRPCEVACQTELTWPLGSSVPHTMNSATASPSESVASSSSQTEAARPFPTRAAAAACAGNKQSPATAAVAQNKPPPTIRPASLGATAAQNKQNKTPAAQRVAADGPLRKGPQETVGTSNRFGSLVEVRMEVSDDLNPPTRTQQTAEKRNP